MARRAAPRAALRDRGRPTRARRRDRGGALGREGAPDPPVLGQPPIEDDDGPRRRDGALRRRVGHAREVGAARGRDRRGAGRGRRAPARAGLAMPQTAIFGPVLAMIFLTFLVWVYMYVRRIGFLRSVEIAPNDLTPARLAELSPPAVSNPSDNLKNLFEIPVIFYALAGIVFATGQVDAVYVAAAWGFVVFRALHSAVHCTINIIMV